MKKIILMGLVIVSFLVSCGSSSEKKSQSLNVDEDTIPVYVPTEENKQDYFYYPEISIISGTIKIESFFGPPGYGENPETDSREDAYILHLDNSINVISKDKEPEEGDYNFTKYNIYKIHVTSSSTTEVKLTNYINKKVRLTGTFSGSFSGHHHADVIMEVEKVEESLGE